MNVVRRWVQTVRNLPRVEYTIDGIYFRLYWCGNKLNKNTLSCSIAKWRCTRKTICDSVHLWVFASLLLQLLYIWWSFCLWSDSPLRWFSWPNVVWWTYRCFCFVIYMAFGHACTHRDKKPSSAFCADQLMQSIGNRWKENTRVSYRLQVDCILCGVICALLWALCKI